MKRIYLDHAATTPVHPEVVRAMSPYHGEIFGNPSSIYSFGQEARAAVEEARRKAAALIQAEPDEIVFTSGGSESNNMALKGTAFRHYGKGGRIVVSAIEHHAVGEPCRFLAGLGFEIVKLPVDDQGLVDPDEAGRAIDDRTILVSIMHANNEIGVIQPIAEIGALCREKKVPMHTDAVQTVGHIPVSVREMGVDMLSCSAHKFNGPKGVGFLYIRRGTRLAPLIHGGNQETGLRAGTENTAGIVGLGAAIDLAAADMTAEAGRLTELRDRLVRGLIGNIPDCRLNGHRARRLPNNVNIAVRYVEGESMLLNLDMEGIAASTGSACTSSTLEASEVLLALGLSHEEAHGSMRFSLGRWTTEAEIDRVIEIFPPVVSKLRAMSPLFPGEKNA